MESVFSPPNILCVHGTQVRHECTQVHDENRSSKVAKSVTFGTDKTLICHSEKRYMYTRSHGFCPVASLVHTCGRYRGMGFWVLAVLAIFALNFLNLPDFRSFLMIDLGRETDGNNEICLGVHFALCIMY